MSRKEIARATDVVPAVMAQRLAELEAELRDRDRIEAALQRVRDEIHSMRVDADWQRVVEILEAELEGVIACYSCGLNLLDLEHDLQIDYHTTAAGLERQEKPGIPPFWAAPSTPVFRPIAGRAPRSTPRERTYARR